MPKILNPDIYEIAKLRADEKYSKPSAYKSMFIVKTYKELGGMYADDGTPKNLDRWKKEQWQDIAGLDYPVYRPTKRISKKTPLTISEIKPENLVKQSILKQKIKGSKNLPPFEGGKRSAKEIKDFLDASYQDKPPEKIDGWILDKKLSNNTGKVYYNPKTKEAVVAHRGTKGVTDWGNNLAYALGMYEYTSRFKKGKSVQDKAEAKYGKKNISTLGHSQGSILSRKLGKDTKEIINVNPAYIFENPAKNEYNIRSSSDVVSGLFAPVAKTREILFPKYSKNRDITIPSQSSTDVIGEHSYSILDRLGEKEIGRENKEQENKISNNNIMKGGKKIGLDEKIKQLVYLGIPQDAVALLLHTGNLEIVWSEWASGNDIKPLLSQVLNSLEPQKSKIKTTFNLNPSNTDEDPLKEISEPYNVEDAVEPLENKEAVAVAGGNRVFFRSGLSQSTRDFNTRMAEKAKKGGGAGASTQLSEEERLQQSLDIIEPRLTRYLEQHLQNYSQELIPDINRDYRERRRIIRELNRIRGIPDGSVVDDFIPTLMERINIPHHTTAQIVGAPEQIPLATDIRRANSRDDMSQELSVAEPVGRGRKKGGMLERKQAIKILADTLSSNPKKNGKIIINNIKNIKKMVKKGGYTESRGMIDGDFGFDKGFNPIIYTLLAAYGGAGLIKYGDDIINYIKNFINGETLEDEEPVEAEAEFVQPPEIALAEIVPMETQPRRPTAPEQSSVVGSGKGKKGGMIVNRGTNPYGVRGGKINIGKSFKKMGKSVSKSFNPVSKAIDSVNRKTTTGLAKVGTAINPAGYALGNKNIRNAMIQSGNVTHDYLLPAVVSAGKPIFDATAMVGSTMLTGNPILGKAVADTVWNEMVTKKGNDPRQNQKSKELGVLSETFGKALSKPYSASLAGKGRGGKTSRWVDFVRMWAKDHDTTYGCALSQPECSKEYRAKYGITKKVTRKMENEMMGMEDKDASETLEGMLKKELNNLEKLIDSAVKNPPQAAKIQKIIDERQNLFNKYTSNKKSLSKKIRDDFKNKFNKVSNTFTDVFE
jgi:hypothetical protein